jgi:hypothetical protein
LAYGSFLSVRVVGFAAKKTEDVKVGNIEILNGDMI